LVLGVLAYAVYGITVGFEYYRVFRQTLGNINANIFARVPLFAVPAALGLMNEYRGWKRMLFLPVLAACAYVLLIAGSRTAILACGAGVLVYILLTAKRKDLKKFYLRFLLPCAAAAAVLGVAFLTIKNPYLLKSIVTRFVMLFQDGNNSSSLRVESIMKALSLFGESPVFGIGAYQYALHNDLVLNHSHCDIAELLMSFGLCGTLLYAAAGYYGGRGIVRTLRLEGLENPPANSMAAAMASLFVIYIVVGIADITVYEVTCQFIWGALTACGMLNRLNGTAV
jgi:O-antigen ligase